MSERPTAEKDARDALAREVADLLAEWRKTCSLMGMLWTDKDAGAFVADALGHRVIPPEVGQP